jgi:hypothetical protein
MAARRQNEDMGSDVSDLVDQRQHVTQFFVEHLDLFDFKPLEKHVRVALHAHTGSPQQDLDARSTRQLLEAIPDVEVVDLPAMTELGRHCASSEVTRHLRAAEYRRSDPSRTQLGQWTSRSRQPECARRTTTLSRSKTSREPQQNQPRTRFRLRRR